MSRKFLGMPIEGDIYSHHERSVKQLSKVDVGKLVNTVLEVPGVRGLAWTQYTPYFNDGDTCVFSAGEPFLSLAGLEYEEGDYGWMEHDYDETGRIWIYPYSKQFDAFVGDDAKEWGSGSYPNRKWEWKINPDDQPNPVLFKAFMALSDAMNSGACDHALLELFGDHAQIIIDKEANKVLVESYDHD